jgi:hypothetical protein
MDLLNKFGLSILSPNDKLEFLETNENECMRLCLLNSKEKLFILQTSKTLETLNQDSILGLFYLMNIQSSNFLKLRWLYIKENSVFLLYEKGQKSLNSYLAEREPPVDVRFYIFKQVVEIVYLLTLFNDDFSDFDPGYFFVNEDTCSIGSSLPVVKIIYHGKIN